MNFNVLIEAIEFSNKNVTKLGLQNNYKHHAYSVGIYCSMIELAQSFESLSRGGVQTGALTIYRTFMEYYVDMKNLSINENYIDVIDLDSRLVREKQLKYAKSGNEYMLTLEPFIKDLPRIKDEIKELQLKLKLKKNQRSYSIKDKFEMSGMISDYALYSYLCCETHCSLDSIMKRHFRDPNGYIELVIHEKDPKEVDMFYLGNMASYLITAGQLISSILQNNLENEFRTYHNNFIGNCE